MQISCTNRLNFTVESLYLTRAYALWNKVGKHDLIKKNSLRIQTTRRSFIGIFITFNDVWYLRTYLKQLMEDHLGEVLLIGKLKPLF